MKVNLTNATKKLCIIGDPVLHSKSPIIQNAMITALGLDYIYLCQSVPRDQTAKWLEAAALAGYAGFNATMPHKEALVPLMDHLDPLAKKCGAVNTVCIKDGEYYGYNTDGPGFLQALADLGVSAAGKKALLLGSGGAAKAVGAALSEVGARVVVANRTVSRAEEVCGMAPASMTPAGFETSELCRLAEESDLLVNCTPLGMEGTGADFAELSFVDALPPGAAVCDAIYAPAETRLLRRARQLGHPTMNGMGMLLHQAILALGHFTGQAPEVEKARTAALKALTENEERSAGTDCG